MRVALDTNVVISALVFPSELMDETFRIASAPGNRIVLPRYVVDETVDVVRRKWPDMVGAAAAFFTLLDFEPIEWDADGEGPDIAIRDPKDYPVIAGAVEGHCDILVRYISHWMNGCNDERESRGLLRGGVRGREASGGARRRDRCRGSR